MFINSSKKHRTLVIHIRVLRVSRHMWHSRPRLCVTQKHRRGRLCHILEK